MTDTKKETERAGRDGAELRKGHWELPKFTVIPIHETEHGTSSHPDGVSGS